MIETSIHTALQESVQDVLEKMFFIELDPEAAGQGESEAEICAQVSFHGDPSGALTLRVTSREARSVAADFLGADADELSDRQISEVICELANMICGSVLSRVESTTTFQLAEPAIVSAASAHQLPDGALSHVVRLSGGSLTVVLETEPLSCPVQEKSAS